VSTLKETIQLQGLQSIWQVCNWITVELGAYLNGDMKFICTVLAHTGASSKYPCPACLIKLRQYDKPYEMRESTEVGSLDEEHSVSNIPLLRIRPTHIVPLPLHIYLGMGEIIFDEILVKLSSQIIVDNVVKHLKIKSLKDREGGGGKTDVFKFTGPELRKLCRSKFPQIISGAMERLQYNKDTVKSVENKAKTLQTWMIVLERYLLRTSKFKTKQFSTLAKSVEEVLDGMKNTFHRNLTPKMHMLRHVVQFVQTHKVMGCVSEQQLESMHAYMNRLLVRHKNMLHQPAEQLRRVLADTLEYSVKKYILPHNV